jgi:hypothetical protein
MSSAVTPGLQQLWNFSQENTTAAAPSIVV